MFHFWHFFLCLNHFLVGGCGCSCCFAVSSVRMKDEEKCFGLPAMLIRWLPTYNTKAVCYNRQNKQTEECILFWCVSFHCWLLFTDGKNSSLASCSHTRCVTLFRIPLYRTLCSLVETTVLWVRSSDWNCACNNHGAFGKKRKMEQNRRSPLL